jgi:type 1 fimbriae regulatory protein FimB/type 1 fimbriae regulatory protein FimE
VAPSGLEAATLHLRRVKKGISSTHPILGDELLAAAAAQREAEAQAHLFTSGSPFTTDALNRQVKRIGEKAKPGFPVHVHMLRHAWGYALANAGHDTRAIKTGLATGPFSIQYVTQN